MAIPATGQVASQGTSGSGIQVREAREFTQVASQLSGKYYESASRGQIFSGTSTTGRAPGTAIGTTPPILLYNPAGSQKRYEILKVTVAAAATGTLGAGGIFHCGFTINGPLASQIGVIPVVGGGALITPICLDIGGAGTSQALLYSLGTLSVNPVALYPAFQCGVGVGGTTATNTQITTEDVDGQIVLEQGAGWCLEGLTGTGTSPLVLCSVVWREIPFSA